MKRYVVTEQTAVDADSPEEAIERVTGRDKDGYQEVLSIGATGTAQLTQKVIDVVFDGPPSAESGRFVEVEDSETGASARVGGKWIEREDGFWALRMEVVD